MAEFPSAVAVPGTAAYAPPLMDFSWLANLPNQFAQGQKNKFDQAQRDRTLALQQPIDASNTQDVLREVLKRGGAQYAEALLPFMLTQQQTEAAKALIPALPGTDGNQGQGGGGAPQGPVGNAPPASASGLQSTNMKTPVTQQGGDAGNGTITDIVTGKLGNTAQAGGVLSRIAMTMNVDPNAPLSAGQQVRVAGLLQRYAPDASAAPAGDPGAASSAPGGGAAAPAARVADAFAAVPGGGSPQPAAAPAPQPQPAPIGGGAPAPVAPRPAQAPGAQPGGAILPQIRMPNDPKTGKPFTDPQEAMLFLRSQAAQIAAGNPQLAKRAAFYDWWAGEIEKRTSPMEIGAGRTIADPRTGAIIFKSASANPTAVALQRYLAENPDASPEQIQAFVQAGRGARSAIGMYMNRYIAEHPEATADDIKRAAQTYTTQTTAQNRFLSGPQGNTIRSLNVVVSHLQTMQELGNALQNGNVRLFNSLSQRFAEETGSPAPTNFDTAKQIVGAEVIKALGVAGAGSQAERQEAADAFNRARSPAQLSGAIDAARKLMVGQLKGLRQQWKVATGLPESEFDNMLEPATRAYFQDENSPAKSAPQNNSENKSPGGENNDGWVALPNGNRIRQVQ